MNIVYTFDNGYVDITLVSIASLLDCNDPQNINIIIVDGGISEKNKKKIKKIISDKNSSVSFKKMVDLNSIIDFNLDSKGWSPICFVRLFYASILNEYDKVLHIDCDTLITGNIEDMYMTDILDVYGAACYDCIPRTKIEAGIARTDTYISNGVLLLNLKKWREDNVENSFIDYMKHNNMPHLDQDVLSAVIGMNVKILNPEYNMMPVTFMYKQLCCELFEKNEPYYDKNQILNALRNPRILHLTGNRHIGRPWNNSCFHPYNALWHSYSLKIGNKIEQKKDKSLWIELTEIPFFRRILFEYEKFKYYKKL